MQPDRQVVRGHAPEDRAKLSGRERLAGDIGEELDAAGAEILHGAVDLGERGVDIVHRQRRNESREAIGMLAAQLRQAAVRPRRKLRRLGVRAGAGGWWGGAMRWSGGLARESTCCSPSNFSRSASRASTSHSVLSLGNAVSTTWPGMSVPRRSR